MSDLALTPPPHVWKTATLQGGIYRFTLSRVWDFNRKRIVWVMLNPSTANADTDDPTIRRCMGFARRWGAGGIDVVNLFAYRTTDPKALLRYDGDPVGDRNDEYIHSVATSEKTAIVVCAWGMIGDHLDRDTAVLKLLMDAGVTPKTLRVSGITNRPAHPLYLPASLKPELEWNGKEWS